jgi:hypothetical protein
MPRALDVRVNLTPDVEKPIINWIPNRVRDKRTSGSVPPTKMTHPGTSDLEQFTE